MIFTSFENLESLQEKNVSKKKNSTQKVRVLMLCPRIHSMVVTVADLGGGV